MLLKKPSAIEGKKLFLFIILGSALLHFLVIFFLPEGRTRSEHLSKAFEVGSSPVSLELEVVPPVEDKQLLAPKEELKEEEEIPQEDLQKRQQFVDTEASSTDEEVDVETEKVGEKGTLASDTVPGGSEDLPRLGGTSEAPSLGSVPGVAPTPPAMPEEETSKALVTEGASQESTQGLNTEETPFGESKLSEVAGIIPGEAIPTPEEQPTAEASDQETKLAETEVEKLLQEAPQQEVEGAKGEMPEGLKTATQAKEPEAKPPIEDKNVPVPAETKKIAKGNLSQADKEESLLGKELEKLEVKEDGLIPIPKKEPQELAYVPPWELRGNIKEATRPKASPPTGTLAKAKPKVAISFNAKTLTGGEIVLMPPMDTAEANAPGLGSPSFNVKKDEYAPYYKHIRDRISWYWYLGYGTRQEIKLETENNKPIIIEFKVYPEGVAKEIKIIQEAGNHLLASRIKDSIEATRLEKFSRYDVKEEYIDVRFNFYFF